MLPVVAHRADQPLFVEMMNRVVGHKQQSSTEQIAAITAPVNGAQLAALALQMTSAALFGVQTFRRSRGHRQLGRDLVGGFGIAGWLTAIAHRMQHRYRRRAMLLIERADAGRRWLLISTERDFDRFLRQAQAVVSEHHDMSVRPVFEVIVDAFFFA